MSVSSGIKEFRKEAKYIEEKSSFDFKTAKREVLREFDEWRKIKEPTILSMNFGKKSGIYVDESPHCWYIQVFYLLLKE